MNEHGFTLVELLVSLGAGALLLTSLGWAVGGLGADLKQVSRSNQSRDLVSSVDTIDTLIENAVFTDANGNALARSPSYLRFRTNAPSAMNIEGHIEVELSITTGEAGKDLLFSVRGQQANIAPVKLIEGARQITLEYEGNGETQSDADFLNLVKLAVLGLDNVEHSWQFKPRINGQGSCIFDLISKTCRK